MLTSSRQLFDEVVILAQRANTIKDKLNSTDYTNSSEAAELNRKFDQFVGHMMDKNEPNEIMIEGIRLLLKDHKVRTNINHCPRFAEFCKKYVSIILPYDFD